MWDIDMKNEVLLHNAYFGKRKVYFFFFNRKKTL